MLQELKSIAPLALAASLFHPSLSAAWVEWTNGSPTGFAATGSFAGGTGAYGGTINATLTNVNDGGTVGVPGLDARVYPSGQLTSSFTANYPVNPNGSFTALANSYNNTQDWYTINLDFSGLTNGYLPSGSIVGIIDLDILENFEDVTAFAPGGAQITTAWLTPMAGQAALLDWFGTDGDQTGFVTGPGGSFAGGVYQFLGPNVNDNSALAGFRTNLDIQAITLFFGRANRNSSINGTGGPGLAIGTDAPEPGTWALFSLSAVTAALRARRASRHRGA